MLCRHAAGARTTWTMRTVTLQAARRRCSTLAALDAAAMDSVETSLTALQST